jgi:hypothetical protein
VTRHYSAPTFSAPTFWAVNTYNEQPSNYASVACTCSYCCQ